MIKEGETKRQIEKGSNLGIQKKEMKGKTIKDSMEERKEG